MLVYRDVPTDPDEDKLTELLIDGDVVACIQHTEDGHFILFEQEGETVTLIDDFTNFYLALNVARTLYQ